MNVAAVKVRPINIAIFAIGGEGGGVLADWIVALAETGGYLAQATSVPGVAQRTGATVYYLELFPKAAAEAVGRAPVLALMPVPGDVDLVIASELMEAARAVERGLVTPDRTTLISSSHRVYAISERIALADGRADSAALRASCAAAARRLIAFDMEAIAEASGSVISAVLFGALAASGTLPLPRSAFEATIKRGGVGVTASLAAFAAGFEGASADAERSETDTAPVETTFPENLQAELRPIVDGLSGESRALVTAGVARTLDYQDQDYAREYLGHLRGWHTDLGDDEQLLAETARQLALAMTYEDTIRVAELKIRPERFARVRAETKIGDGQILEIAEFFHPRTQEIADTLPAGAGRWLLRSRWARPLADRLTRSGRIVKTTSLGGFLLLYLIAACKPWRRRSLRHAAERQSIVDWLRTVRRVAATDAGLALEVARCRALIKGYGDTHARGRAKYDELVGLLSKLSGRPDGSGVLAQLRKAALADEDGAALQKALQARELAR